MHFSFLTLFPKLIAFYFEDSILKRALNQGIFTLEITNMRTFSPHKFQRADFALVGGGAGQILDPYMVENALKNVQSASAHVIFLTPSGKRFCQQDAKRLATHQHLVLICGRYDGFDERLIEAYADEVLSIGDFVLTGGELASLCLCDSVVRQLEGTLGNVHSLEQESFEDYLLEAPNFARTPFLDTPSCAHAPTISEYSKGNHGRIKILMRDLSMDRTRFHAPSLYALNRSLQTFNPLTARKGDDEKPLYPTF
ncbi:tRNA (guanosine(37)-N1)-methyltransferase TrmD [Helicobacter baculiformis]|uniref:tRNA (guanine-N(1)-)-methyltransferase n=1 Tax=Helicobacter baculiformis TaxID=427351 RepID=A0ABV7ZJG7_9HELI|nr:tRNA (guanosine(37)-N1)-methyltransferase TrmD [Helicobacter baculiformis]